MKTIKQIIYETIIGSIIAILIIMILIMVAVSTGHAKLKPFIGNSIIEEKHYSSN